MSGTKIQIWDEVPRGTQPSLWYSKHKARNRKSVGRWFVMKNERVSWRIIRSVVVKDLDSRKEAIAMVKLLETTDDHARQTR